MSDEADRPVETSTSRLNRLSVILDTRSGKSRVVVDPPTETAVREAQDRSGVRLRSHVA